MAGEQAQPVVSEEPHELLAVHHAAGQIQAVKEARLEEISMTIATRGLGLSSHGANATNLLSKAKAVSNWSKASFAVAADDKKPVYDELVTYLEDLEVYNVKSVLRASAMGHDCEDLLTLMAAMFKKVQVNHRLPGHPDEQSVMLDAWNPQLIKGDLRDMEKLSLAITKRFAELQDHAAGDPHISLKKIQAVERVIFASDKMQNAREAIDAIRAHEKEHKMVMTERAVEEGELDVLIAVCEDAKVKLRAAMTWGEQLNRRRADLLQRKGKIQKSSDMTDEEAITALNEMKVATQEHIKEVMVQQDAAVKNQQSSLERVTSDFEQKIRALELELVNAEGAVGVHFFVIIDRSGSMHGARATAAYAALESFKAARASRGGQDRVSVVAFDTEALLIVSAQPLLSDFVGILRAKAPPRGGTLYKPAWQEVKKHLADVQPGFKCVAIFITDGEAGDVQAAAVVAKEVFDHFSSSGGMRTFVVNIDKAVKDCVLEPIVKAGNGGQIKIEACGQTTPLLVGVYTDNMVREFQRIADLSNYKEQSLKHRISLSRARVVEHREQHLKNIQRNEVETKQKLEGLKNSMREAELSRQSGDTVMKALLKQQLGNIEEELNDLNRSIQNSETDVSNYESQVGKAEKVVDGRRKHLESTHPAHVSKVAALKKMGENEVEALSCVEVSQDTLQQAAGTSDMKTLWQRIDELDELKRLCTANLFDNSDQLCMLGSLNRFLANLAEDIREPLPDSLRHTNKAGFVLKPLLAVRGIAGGCTETGASFEVLLKHEARRLGVEEGDMKKVLTPILTSGLTAEDFCAACGAKDADEVVKEEQARLVKLVMDQQLNKNRNYSRQNLKMKNVNGVLSKLETEIEQLVEQVSQNPTDEKLAMKLERKQENASSLESQVLVMKEELSEIRGEAEEEMETTVRLIRTAVKLFSEGYKQELSRFELQQVVLNFQAYHEKIHQPMKQLVQVVHGLKQAFGPGSSDQSSRADVKLVRDSLRTSSAWA